MIGVAKDYDDLCRQPDIRLFAEYFAPEAEEIFFWCMPRSASVSGSYEIAEEDFLRWARSRGWEPRDVKTSDDCETIQAPQISWRTWIMPEDGYWYGERVLHKRGTFKMWFGLYFDRMAKKVHFIRLEDF